MVLTLAGTAICGSAWGVTAKVIEVTLPPEVPGGDPEKVAAPALIAEPGEANRVTIGPGPAPTAPTVLIEDLGPILTVGAGCVSIDAHHARCDNKESQRVVVIAGDLNDIVVASQQVSIDAHGGSGVDVLVGAGGLDRLSGGGGAGDVLAGGIGNDVLGDGDGLSGAAVDADAFYGGPGKDTVSYATRSAAVLVNLGDAMPDGQAAEGDQLSSIENAAGGKGADRLTGSAGRNVLTGGPGKDKINAGAGPDNVDGGSGADRIRSEAGNDVVAGGKDNDLISLGRGNDRVDDKQQLGKTGRDQVTCGDGSDHVTATQDGQVDKLARSCERFTAAESVADGNFVADVDAVTARLHGLRRSGNTALVPVRCARAKNNPACVITGELRGAGGSGATLARPIARLTLKAGKQGVLRMALTRAGMGRVRRGRKVRLLIAERTPNSAPLELLERARALVQILVF